jgi:hypothetical protein
MTLRELTSYVESYNAMYSYGKASRAVDEPLHCGDGKAFRERVLKNRQKKGQK